VHRAGAGITSEAVEPLVEALTLHPSVTRLGVHFAPITAARFHEIRTGTVTWDWCDRNSAERGLRAALAYDDLDGQIVSIGISVANKQVTEIELWRGDGKQISPCRVKLICGRWCRVRSIHPAPECLQWVERCRKPVHFIWAGMHSLADNRESPVDKRYREALGKTLPSSS
jgi:hypothetical protein